MMEGIFMLEEKLACEHDPQSDVQSSKEICKKIREYMSGMKASKGKHDLDERRRDICILITSLKKINRMMHLRNRSAKQSTEAAKQQVDANDLQLQNLLCEKMHLKREIQKCHDFKSRDEGISLVSEQEFYEQAPDSVTKKEVTLLDNHQKRLARLDWELKERQRLSAEVASNESKVKQLKEQNKQLTARLESLKPKLQDVLKATRPVQQHLGLEFEQISADHRAARLLPRALYVIYVLLQACRDSTEPDIELCVDGDVESAATLEDQPCEQEEESDSEEERDAVPADARKTSKKRHGQKREKLQEYRKRLLRTHPLAVNVSLPCQDGLTVKLSFQFVIRLRVVCVSAQLLGTLPPLAATASELLSPQSLLSCLYPGDTGLGCPGPAAQLELDKVSLKDIASYDASLGRPYAWTQRLAGLDLLTAKSQSSLAGGAEHVLGVIHELQQRLGSRLKLQRQLVALEDKIVSVSAEAQRLFPSRIESTIVSWERCKHAPAHCEELMSSGHFSSTNTLFTLELKRDNARLVAHVSLSPAYPREAPVFCVSVEHNQQHLNRTNSSAIKDIEAEVNLHYDELCDGVPRDELLTNQIQRLMVVFDVYVNSTDSDPASINVPKPNTGRSRARPLRYNPNYRLFLAR